MSRKRTPDQEPAEAPVIFNEVPAAETATAVADLPASDTNGDQSFADRVGQKTYKPAPDPFGIAADYVAGVRLFESKQDRQMAIMFGEGRPEDGCSRLIRPKTGGKWRF